MITEIDKKGRILLPKKVREKLQLEEGNKLRIEVRDESIILTKEISTAEKYAGKFKSKIRIPEDLDEFLSKVISNWWKENT